LAQPFTAREKYGHESPSGRLLPFNPKTIITKKIFPFLIFHANHYFSFKKYGL